MVRKAAAGVVAGLAALLLAGTTRAQESGGTARVYFEGDSQPRTRLYRAGEGSEAGYVPICSSPCVALMPVGSYRLALAQENGTPKEVEGVVRIAGDSTIRATYESRASTRAAGWSIVGVSVVAGLALVGLSAKTTASPYCDTGPAMA
ncbi:MAG TPA: hypothetical protein VF765_10845, partial [Polyangiaceae bacterium]